MKGVILTAGYAKRLKPITEAFGKVLLPIYDKPMIYYSVSLLIECGITDILIICNKTDINLYKTLFDNKFAKYGINITFTLQKQALGTAHALTYAKDFVKEDNFVLMFGDNIFIGHNVSDYIQSGIKNNQGVTLFAVPVNNPQKFGVVELDGNNITKIVEKPQEPKSNLAITGLFVFNNDVFKLLSQVVPSVRGEYELTDVHNLYLKNRHASAVVIPDSINWLDTGTHDSLLAGGNMVKEFENNSEIIGCIELSIFKQGLISFSTLIELANAYPKEYADKIISSVTYFKNKLATH